MKILPGFLLAWSIGMTALSAQSTSVPAMTSATAPSGIVTQSGTYGSGYEGWKVFDSSDSTMWISATYQTPAWIGYEFAGAPRRVVNYSIRYVNGSIRTRAPRNWTLQGWNGSSWVILDARSGQINWGGVETRTFSVATPGYYNRYRLNVTDDNDTRTGVVVISMGKLFLYADSTGTTYCRPPYSPGYWNDGSTIQYNNNCYNYSNNKRTDTFAQPGRASGRMYGSITATEVAAAAERDGLEPTTASATSPTGKTKMALVIWPGYDFHWYRQDSDGRWSHKPGGTQATNRDNSGALITNPETANRGYYTQFVGYYFTPSDCAQGQGHANIR